MKCIVMTLFVFVVFVKANAQFDIARLEIVNLPKGGNQDIEYSRIRAVLNVPIKLKNDQFLILGADYSIIDIEQIENVGFDTEELSDFQTFEVNVGYTKQLKNNWRLIGSLKPGVTTNSVKNTSFLKSMRLSGGLVFYKDEKETKQYDLLIGVFYNAFNGFAFPLPFVKYHKIIDAYWSYDLGFPKMNLEYTFNPKHAVKAYATIDGFNSNLIETVTITEGVIQKFNARVLVAGFKYDYTLIEHLELFFTSGYIFDSAINFRDNNADDLVQVKGDNAIYLRAGIRLKL